MDQSVPLRDPQDGMELLRDLWDGTGLLGDPQDGMELLKNFQDRAGHSTWGCSGWDRAAEGLLGCHRAAQGPLGWTRVFHLGTPGMGQGCSGTPRKGPGCSGTSRMDQGILPGYSSELPAMGRMPKAMPYIPMVFF